MRSLLLSTLIAVCLWNPARADTLQYTYDSAGRLSAVIDPVNGSAIYTYDSVGNITSVTRNPASSVVIAQVTPNTAAAGSVITIVGTGIGTTSNTTVSFNGLQATPSSVSATSLTVAVPSGASTGPITLTSPAGSSTTSVAFTVQTPSSPSISSVTPTTTTAGSTITVSGSGFDPVVSNNKMYINGRAVRIMSASQTTLTGSVPALTTGYLTVETPGGSVTTNSYVIIPPAALAVSNIGSAVSTSIGSSATITTAASGQFGLAFFDAVAGQRLSMSLTSESFSFGSMSLYGPDGAQVGSSIPLNPGQFYDVQTLAIAGTYTILLVPSNSDQSGTATVSLFSVPSDLTGTLVANSSPSPISLTTTAPGQNTSLTFSGSVGQRVNLEMQLTNSGSQLGGCSGLTVTAPDRITQVYASGCFNNSYTNYSGVFTLPQNGTYQVSYNPATTDVGTTTFSLYDVPPDPTASITTDGTATTLTTTVPGQNMSLTFTGTSGQQLNLELQIPSGDTQVNGCSSIIVLSPDGITQAYSNRCFNYSQIFSGSFILTQGGNYQILYSIGNPDIGAVTFSLYTVPPDAASAISIDGSSVTLTTTVPGQNMNLTFSGTSGQQISLELQLAGSSPLQAGCGAITVLAPDGTTQVYYNRCFNNTTSYSGTLTLAQTGTYQVFFYPTSGTVGSATFSLASVQSTTFTIRTDGTPLPITTTSGGQNIVLTFSGTAGQQVNLESQIPSGGAQYNGCVPIVITAPDGSTQIYSNYCFNYYTNYSGVLNLPTSGTYTITYSPGVSDVGLLTFTLYTVNAASATITPGGGTTSLTTTGPGQGMSLTFAANAGDRVSLYVNETSGLGSCNDTVKITPPGGGTPIWTGSPYCTAVFSGTVPSEYPITSTVPTLPSTGTYTITLTPYQQTVGTAAFTLYSVPADSTGSLTVDAAAANFTVTTPAQAVRATFIGSSGGSATVGVSAASVTPSGSCYYVTVLEPDGSTILRGDSSCNTNYSSGSLSLPSSGTYTVVVSAENSTATGTYSLQVSTP